MELTERELLVKIEQQLKTLSESHREVLSEISAIFNKQDIDSKTLAILRTEFANHLEAYKLRNDDQSRLCVSHSNNFEKRMAKNEGHIEKLFAQLEEYRIQAETVRTVSDALPQQVKTNIQNNYDSLISYIDKRVTEEKTNRETFETKIDTSVKGSKFFISIIAFLITLVTSLLFPVIIDLLKHLLKV